MQFLLFSMPGGAGKSNRSTNRKPAHGKTLSNAEKKRRDQQRAQAGSGGDGGGDGGGGGNGGEQGWETVGSKSKAAQKKEKRLQAQGRAGAKK